MSTDTHDLTPPASTDAGEWAAFYIKKGLRVISLRSNPPIERKEPHDKGWNTSALVYAPDDFSPDDNIGIRSIDGLVILDLDSPEAVAMGDAFLPRTGMVWGRDSKPRAKRAYLSSFEKKIEFKDEHAKKMLLEIRVNHHDVAPPSIHESDQRLWWSGPIGSPDSIDHDALLRPAQLLATASLVARHYPKEGGWHEMMLALAGLFLRIGLTEDEALQVLRAVCAYHNDPLTDEHVVRSTYARGADAALKGEVALKKATSSDFVDTIKDYYGLRFKTAEGFSRNKKGDVATTDPNNIRVALAILKVDLTFNDFTKKTIVTHPPLTIADATKPAYHGIISDEVDADLYFALIDRFRWQPVRKFFSETLEQSATMRKFHPVKQYLESLAWDKTPRLDTWIIRLAGAPDDAYVRAVSSLPLLAAVRRVYEPGAKFDEILILESGQGLNKSTSLKTLCYDEDWFLEDLPLHADSKIIIERTAGKWLVEAADLSGLRKSDIEQLKAMLSRTVDTSRLAFGHHGEHRARQFVIFGTTNSHKYLKDPTGNRRFWPVRVKEFDLGALKAERDQLWAEAYHRAIVQHDSIRLDPSLYATAALRQERRRSADPWEDALVDVFGATAGEATQRVTNDAVWKAVGIIEIADRSTREQARLSEIMQRLGFVTVKVSTKRDGKKTVVGGWKREGVQPRLHNEEND